VSGVPEGLPGALPEGEVLLWQGRPDARVLARRSFHLRSLALYFAAIAVAVAVFAVRRGATPLAAAEDAGRAMLVGTVPVALVAAFAWAVARSTVYTVTNRRVAMRFGVALPMTVNLPFARIESASVLAHADGSGDVALTTTGARGLGYLVLWPHARPWRLGRPQPAMRGLREVEAPARILGRALAASAGLPTPVRAPVAASSSAAHSPLPA
jgi:hypothetical protein